MSSGLLALLDDVAAIAKVAAASLDDVAAQAAKAGAKAAGVVIDDAAVTPRYVVGFAADRELPIVWRIAKGSLRNKLYFLLPGALLLGFFAPWAIAPLLMAGGAFLCFEGFEKIAEKLFPHAAPAQTPAPGKARPVAEASPASLEDMRVNGAIRTDFILSAEIMAITLASVADAGLWTKLTVLAGVGIGITGFVYGAVALIVKADDAGLAMAGSARPVSALLRRGEGTPGRADRWLAPLTQAFGRGLVRVMPRFLAMLAWVGTVAMLWVGGGIIVHGLEGYGFAGLAHALHGASLAAGAALPWGQAVLAWLVGALGAALIGIAVGAAIAPLAHRVIAPSAAWALARLRGS